MEPSSKNKPVVHETEVIVPLDPAHEEKPTLVERERIEKEQAEKEENQVTKQEKEAVCPLPDEEEGMSDISMIEDYPGPTKDQPEKEGVGSPADEGIAKPPPTPKEEDDR